MDGTQDGQNQVTQKGADSATGGGYVPGSDYTSTDEFGYTYHGELDQNSGGVRGTSGTGTNNDSNPGSNDNTNNPNEKGSSPMIGIIGAIVCPSFPSSIPSVPSY